VGNVALDVVAADLLGQDGFQLEHVQSRVPLAQQLEDDVEFDLMGLFLNHVRLCSES